ncbi:MAG TPA: HAMP domain-containing sensor histidine kinase [Longimicrobium sp.]|jgi:signal transduction histidine kinase
MKDPLIHALAGVTDVPDPADAVGPLLAAAMVRTGATSGAVVGADDVLHACAGCQPERVRALVAGPVAEALARPGFRRGAQVLEAERLVWVPLELRGVRAGSMLLFLGGEAPGAEALREAEAAGTAVALVLENGQLYEEARLARQSRDHFLVALNHELRTPATALLLESDILRSGLLGDLPPRTLQMLERAEEHVSEIVRVLEGVRELGEAQSPAQEPELVEPRKFVGDLLRRVEPTARRKGLTLSLHYPPNLPLLQTDPARLARVLLLLLDNAIRFTGEGKVEVRLIRAMRPSRTRRAPVLVISVRDTGPGIPADELERVFEPFAQVQEGARSGSSERGVGLGLALARRLSRTLAAEVTLESELGKGTTASLILPYQ